MLHPARSVDVRRVERNPSSNRCRRSEISMGISVEILVDQQRCAPPDDVGLRQHVRQRDLQIAFDVFLEIRSSRVEDVVGVQLQRHPAGTPHRRHHGASEAASLRKFSRCGASNGLRRPECRKAAKGSKDPRTTLEERIIYRRIRNLSTHLPRTRVSQLDSAAAVVNLQPFAAVGYSATGLRRGLHHRRRERHCFAATCCAVASVGAPSFTSGNTNHVLDSDA